MGVAEGFVVSNTPTRTCVGCRRRDAQPMLLRVVKNGPTVLALDLERRIAGRGAWLHPDLDCLALALKRGGFARAFKAQVNAKEVEGQLRTVIVQNELIQAESGSEN
ncbi:YlxR family protein [Psychromicrobium lacuslunae]|uniref:YlxR domain-containing protein n=1 Tax=Psychromicrobium lacuslunae TaxID=1618207 RepID=A0A0D4BVV0_9MICC|nr:YlxR family protein [Psychromicrobium lacuslunae]AJT40547.1 hypothetical protein UM93_01515 [Psychromicrobium lacuslunae]